MSLLVWLPLNGNIDNYGLNNTKFSIYNGSTGVAVSNSGKIGKCYERTAGAGNAIRSASTINLSDSFSMCCWAYITGCPTGDSANGIISNHSHSSNTGVGINVKYVSATDFRISCSTGTGTSRTYCSYYGTTNIKDSWHHLAITYNKPSKTLQLLVDGKSEYTLNNYSNGSKADYVDIFNWSTDLAATSGTYKALGRVNDVRIYDHCLSPKEVKEISKAKILHFPMNQVDGVIGGRNLLKQYVRAGGRCIKLSDTSIKVGTDVADTYFYLKSHVALTTGVTYTLSCDAENVPSGLNWIFGIRDQNAPAKFPITRNGRNTYTFTLDANVGAGVEFIMDDAGGRPTTAPNIILSNFKLEIGNKATPWSPAPEDFPKMKDNIVYDVSGYGNNGTVTDANCPTWSSDTVLGQGSYYFGSNKKISVANLPIDGLANSYTISWWSKGDLTSKMMWGYSNGNRLNYYEGLYCNTGDGGSNPYRTASGTTISKPSGTAWHHYVMVGDGSKSLLYLDGVLYGTALYYRPITGSTIYINGWDASTSYCFNGLTNDFRIYATALSADDIKELYQTRFSVTDNGSLICGETIELGDNLAYPMTDAFMTNSFKGGVNRYTQSNCSVTMENNKMHIVRTANVSPTANGNTMWGGALIQFNHMGIGDVLQKYHTYLILIHAEGKSSNYQASIGFTNQMGWGGGGLSPSPSNVEYTAIPTNFNGSMELMYKFTINDDVYKTCTSSYSGFVAGTSYLSYRDFMVGWSYTDTGSMGTNLYLSNIRLYDITGIDLASKGLSSNGVLNCLDASETAGGFKIMTSSSYQANQIIEN